MAGTIVPPLPFDGSELFFEMFTCGDGADVPMKEMNANDVSVSSPTGLRQTPAPRHVSPTHIAVINEHAALPITPPSSDLASIYKTTTPEQLTDSNASLPLATIHVSCCALTRPSPAFSLSPMARAQSATQQDYAKSTSSTAEILTISPSQDAPSSKHTREGTLTDGPVVIRRALHSRWKQM